MSQEMAPMNDVEGGPDEDSTEPPKAACMATCSSKVVNLVNPKFTQFTNPLLIALFVGVSTLVVGIVLFTTLQSTCADGFQAIVGTDRIQRDFVRTILKTPGVKDLCLREAYNFDLGHMVGHGYPRAFVTETSCRPTPMNKPMESKGLNKKGGDKMSFNTPEAIKSFTLAKDVPFCSTGDADDAKSRYERDAAKADTDGTKYPVCNDREIQDRNQNGVADQTGDDPTTTTVTETDYYEYGESGQVLHLFTYSYMACPQSSVTLGVVMGYTGYIEVLFTMIFIPLFLLMKKIEPINKDGGWRAALKDTVEADVTAGVIAAKGAAKNGAAAAIA